MTEKAVRVDHGSEVLRCRQFEFKKDSNCLLHSGDLTRTGLGAVRVYAVSALVRDTDNRSNSQNKRFLATLKLQAQTITLPKFRMGFRKILILWLSIQSRKKKKKETEVAG